MEARRSRRRNKSEDDAELDLPTAKFPVVGIGASAGGISALKAFIPAIPRACGVAFVVVQHLDPNHSSMLSTLLGRDGNIPVVEISKHTKIEPDHIYVIPPNATLIFEVALPVK